MKKFIIRILLLLALICVVDYVYGKVLVYLRDNTHGGLTYKDKYICEKVNKDILIFGSSRARLQYDPKIISDSLNMSCYNCGYDGMGIIFHYGRMKIITQRYMPKVIIYDVLPVLDEMVRDDNVIFINNLRPYYSIKGIDSIFWKVDATEKFKMYSKMYQYHSKFQEYLLDYSSTKIDELGYCPVNRFVAKGQIIKEKTDYKVDSLKLYFLEKFIKEYKGRTHLLFIASPRYMYKTYGNAFDPIIKLCSKYNVPFLNFYSDPAFIYNNKYYADGTHFNKIGATAYTKKLVKYIKYYLISNN
jgi:hypothetical protein